MSTTENNGAGNGTPPPATPAQGYPNTPYSAAPTTHPAGPQPGYSQGPYGQGPAPKATNGLAIAGVVLGGLALLGSWIPILNVISILLGVIGAILALVGLIKSSKIGSGKALAVVGIVLSVLAVIASIAINAVVFVAADEVVKAVEESTETSVAPADGSDASDDLGKSRENPAPVGSAVTGGNWSVTVNSVDEVSADAFGEAAASGSILLQVNLTATYRGDDPQGETPWANVKFVTPKGTSIGTTDGSTLFSAEDSFNSLDTLYKDASTTGNQIFEVPANGWEDGVLAVSPGILSKDTFVALK